MWSRLLGFSRRSRSRRALWARSWQTSHSLPGSRGNPVTVGECFEIVARIPELNERGLKARTYNYLVDEKGVVAVKLVEELLLLLDTRPLTGPIKDDEFHSMLVNLVNGLEAANTASPNRGGHSRDALLC